MTRYPHIYSVKRLAHLTLVGAIAGLSVLSGVSLDLVPATPSLHWQPAYAQAITDQDITSYANAVLQMDGARNTAYAQIKDLLINVGLDVDDYGMTCTDMGSISRLPRNIRGDVRTIMTDYCNAAADIVKNNGLTVQRFNAITEAHRQDPALAERIQAELLRLQQ